MARMDFRWRAGAGERELQAGGQRRVEVEVVVGAGRRHGHAGAHRSPRAGAPRTARTVPRAERRRQVTEKRPPLGSSFTRSRASVRRDGAYRDPLNRPGPEEARARDTFFQSLMTPAGMALDMIQR